MKCPPDWIDKSMLILSASTPGPSGVAANIVITRDRMPADLPATPAERMAALLDRQVAEMTAKLAGFHEVSRRVIGPQNSIRGEMTVEWVSGQADLTQALTFVDAGDGDLLIATGTAARSEFAEAQPKFAELLKSFKVD